MKINKIYAREILDSRGTPTVEAEVVLDCGQIKTGSLSRSERVAKYNPLLKIEEELL